MHHQLCTICSVKIDVNALNIVSITKKQGRTNTTLTCCFKGCTHEDCYGVASPVRNPWERPLTCVELRNLVALARVLLNGWTWRLSRHSGRDKPMTAIGYSGHQSTNTGWRQPAWSRPSPSTSAVESSWTLTDVNGLPFQLLTGNWFALQIEEDV